MKKYDMTIQDMEFVRSSAIYNASRLRRDGFACETEEIEGDFYVLAVECCAKFDTTRGVKFTTYFSKAVERYLNKKKDYIVKRG